MMRAWTIFGAAVAVGAAAFWVLLTMPAYRVGAFLMVVASVWLLQWAANRTEPRLPASEPWWKTVLYDVSTLAVGLAIIFGTRTIEQRHAAVMRLFIIVWVVAVLMALVKLARRSVRTQS
jgi:hypothetical protein